MKSINVFRKAKSIQFKIICGLAIIFIFGFTTFADSGLFIPNNQIVNEKESPNSSFLMNNPDSSSFIMNPYSTDSSFLGEEVGGEENLGTIPASLLKYLSDDDRQKLEEYGQNAKISDSDLQALQLYAGKLDQLQNTSQFSKTYYDYFTKQINFQPFTANISSTEPQSFSDSFQSFFFQDWSNLPSYSVLNTTNENLLNTTTIQSENKFEQVTQVQTKDYQLIDTHIITDNQEISSRLMTSENWNISERTEVTGKPQIKLISENLSGLDNLTIPIILDKITNTQQNTTWITTTQDIKLGFEYDLPNLNENLELTLLIFKFKSWKNFEAGFHLVFPARLTIEYPAEVIKGAEYSFKVTLTPIDLPNYEEFMFKFIYNSGDGFDVILPEVRFEWRSYRVRVFWWWVNIPYIAIIITFKWHPIFNFPSGYNFKLADNYTTPLAGEKVDIHFKSVEEDSILKDYLPDLDLLPILAKAKIPYVSATCDLLQNFISIGFSLGHMEVTGDTITGDLKVAAGETSASENMAVWSKSGDTQSLSFRVPFTDKDYLSLSVSNLVYHVKDISWVPEFFISFKDVDIGKMIADYIANKTKFGVPKGNSFEIPEWLVGPKNLIVIPLHDWWGEFRFPLFAISFGPKSIPGLYSYDIRTSDISSSDIYDFTMDVKDITSSSNQEQGKFITSSTNDLLYQITLENTFGASDVLELKVNGLPYGYIATFDKENPYYEVGSKPIKANLIISPPAHVDKPPGNIIFNIIGTSQGKRNMGLSNTSLIKDVSLEIKEITDLSLSLDLPTDPFETIQLTPNMVLPIKFLGENLGNVIDNFTVIGKLYSSETILRTWEQNFSVNPYGSGSGEYYKGEFVFNFSKADLFPSPGLYTLEIQAISNKMPTVMKIESRVLNFNDYYDLQSSISPINTTMFANYKTDFVLEVKNTGNVRTNYTLSSDGWISTFLNLPAKILDLDPEQIVNIGISLTFTNPSLVKPDNYTFKIIASADGSENQVASIKIVTVTVLEPDYTPPSIIYKNEWSATSGELQFPKTPLTFNLKWDVFDDNPKNYSVFIDTILYQTGIWANTVPIGVPITGINQLDNGNHNITVVVADQVNNIASDQVWITIVDSDTIDPVIDPVTNAFSLPQNFNYSHFLIWNCTEEYLYNATVLLNGTALSQENLYIQGYSEEPNKFLARYEIKKGSLSPGKWNFTFFVQDMNNNTAYNTIFVNVTGYDSDPPQIITNPYSSAYAKRDETITFMVSESYPDGYELLINSMLEINSTYLSGVPIILNVDELNLFVGANNLELKFFDLSGHITSYQWVFTLYDIDPPNLINKPNDFTIFEHNYTTLIPPTWEVQDFDIRPGSYEIFVDGNRIRNGTWTYGNNIISMPLEAQHLLPGIHQFDASFRDRTGNMVHDVVQVTVLDVIAPYIWPINNIQYESLYSASWFEFFVSESHLKSFKLYKNGSIAAQGTMSNNFPYLFVDISSLPGGDYIYYLEVYDESGNLGKATVSVQVTDNYPPYIEKQSDLIFSEDTINNSLIWHILEANPDNYSLYLDNQLMQSGVLTNLNFTYLITNLTLGLHEYTLIVYDKSGFSYSSSIYVTVVDITAPKISHLADSQFRLGNPYSELVWQANDRHPSNYILKLNGQSIIEDQWSGDTIKINLAGWSVGTYNIELIVTDTSGNTAKDIVVVFIIESESTTSATSISPTPGFEILSLFIPFYILFKRKQRKNQI